MGEENAGSKRFSDQARQKRYEKMLGLSTTWSVQVVDLQIKEMKVTLKLTHHPLWRFRCPERDEEYPTHDHRQRMRRHIDTGGYVTMIGTGVRANAL